MEAGRQSAQAQLTSSANSFSTIQAAHCELVHEITDGAIQGPLPRSICHADCHTPTTRLSGLDKTVQALLAASLSVASRKTHRRTWRQFHSYLQ
jgi:hypothetical protein